MDWNQPLSRKRVALAGLLAVGLAIVVYFHPFFLSFVLVEPPGRGVAITVDNEMSDDWTSDEVVEYDEMTQGQQELFDEARTQSGLTYVPDDVDHNLWYQQDTPYVRYNGSVYEVSIVED
ncbi:hypothetical protein [Halococcoides cellulosivorans]|uniref:DUF7979 domain-containing protein n=1 Tax=Halococcoides cellulosivorans TaxID=1679096 RepID=A0A2R4X3M5_9EURY|nr:hypothetical protein [Halococcoides cellulosivorans]AWB28389.1 hypothetical protein HARCEL1_12070 [Halococcoides cellulosivorans]